MECIFRSLCYWRLANDVFFFCIKKVQIFINNNFPSSFSFSRAYHTQLTLNHSKSQVNRIIIKLNLTSCFTLLILYPGITFITGYSQCTFLNPRVNILICIFVMQISDNVIDCMDVAHSLFTKVLSVAHPYIVYIYCRLSSFS